MSNFPEHILKDCKSALCLFSAAFGGANDIQYIHKAGVKRAICIDYDPDKLNILGSTYPEYTMILSDVFRDIEDYCGKWDIVVSDQWTNQDEQLWGYYEKLKSITNKFMVIGISQRAIDEGLKLPEGELMKRSDYLGGLYWHITAI